MEKMDSFGEKKLLYPVKQSTTDLVGIEMHFISEEMTAAVGDVIYERLAGLPEYVESEILLQVDNKDVVLGLGVNCTKHALISAVGDSIALAMQKTR